MADIVLTTLNARYIHAAFGLRYLLANLGPLQPRAEIREFDIHQRPVDVAEALLARNPRIIGLGVYIWNVVLMTELVSVIKRLRPDITIVLGGPEVSYELEPQSIVQLADHVITGEADLKFAEVCRALLERRPPARRNGVRAPAGAGSEIGAPALPKVIAAEPPDFSQLVLPYDLYTDDDIAHRVIYVEASRGCPFTCEFCLSSLDVPVRQVPLPALLEHLQRLLDRGVKQFKFVDRTFNLNEQFSRAILEFFRERLRPGLFLHFEMVPDRLPVSLRDVIAKFPAGSLQFEVGVQTLNETVGALIKRRQHAGRLEENLRFLRQQTGAHVHADLIVGLPGETIESFAAGFDRLVRLGPQEIQVGILKRLRGTVIARHDAEWQMIYNAEPPYEILQNKLIDFAAMQKLRRFARYWDLVANSGNFLETTPLIWSGSGASQSDKSIQQPETMPLNASPFHAFLRFSEWLHRGGGRTDGLALVRLMELVFNYLTRELKLDTRQVAAGLWRDYQRGGRHDKPLFLKDLLPPDEPPLLMRRTPAATPKRQARHLA